MRNSLFVLSLLCLISLTSCYNRGQQTPDAWDLTRQQIDSISFSTTHHYTQNYNFMVTASRLPLADALPDMAFDTMYVVGGERIVVADIQTVPTDTIDSVWVKVARDQIHRDGFVKVNCYRVSLLTTLSRSSSTSSRIPICWCSWLYASW